VPYNPIGYRKGIGLLYPEASLKIYYTLIFAWFKGLDNIIKVKIP